MKWINKIRKILKRARSENGMSLVEVVIMIVVLSISIGPLSRLATMNLKGGSDAADITKAVMYARGVMEQVVADYRSNDVNVGGFDNVLVNWDGVAAQSPPAGVSGTVSVSGVDSVMGIATATVQVSVSTNTGKTVDLFMTLSN